MISNIKRLKAILILGPTGSGKTPLGNLMEKEGLRNQRYYHFDFGENLRSITRTDKRFTAKEIALINRVLTSGALLENEHFCLARKILRHFIKRNHIGPASIIILNGLPRHVDQAKEMASILKIEAVIHLACSPDVVLARIRNNIGGDRVGRADDGISDVRNKLRIFNRRTSMLIKHYRSRKTEIITVVITENTTTANILKYIKKSFGGFRSHV